MTKGEHTYVRTYVHTYGTDPISPTTSLCEGIKSIYNEDEVITEKFVNRGHCESASLGKPRDAEK